MDRYYIGEDMTTDKEFIEWNDDSNIKRAFVMAGYFTDEEENEESEE